MNWAIVQKGTNTNISSFQKSIDFWSLLCYSVRKTQRNEPDGENCKVQGYESSIS